MQMNWEPYIGKTINVTMFENFGIVRDPSSDNPVYEIVFKSGTLIGAFDDGLLLETRRDAETIRIYVLFKAIKCVEIYNF